MIRFKIICKIFIVAFLFIGTSAFATALKAGDKAPSFSTSIYGGDETIDLSSLKGKAVLLNFWATWCTPCRVEMPVLNELAKSNPSDVVLIAVNYQQSPEMIRRYLAKNEIDFSVALDSEGVISKMYKVTALPTTIFIDRSGNITDIHEGMLTRESLKEKVAKIVAVDK